MGYLDIMAIIPHRHPFLLVDGILEIQGMDSVTGFKNVSLNDPYLIIEPNQKPRLPASIVIECINQVGTVAVLSFPAHAGKLLLFAAIEDFRLLRPIYAGDQLVSKVEKVYLKAGIGKMKATGRVNNEVVAEGFFSFAIADRVPPT